MEATSECTRCGHALRDHRDQRCMARVAGDAGLTIGRCGCTGFSVEPLQSRPQVEPVEVHLRRPNEPLPA